MVENDRCRALEKWLRENVDVIPASAALVLRRIEVDWEAYPRELRGEVSIDRDGQPLESWRFWIDITGRTQISPPIFHSPLGVPASFAKYEVDVDTKERLRLEVQSMLPPFGGLEWTDRQSSILARLDPSFDIAGWERSMGREGPPSRLPFVPRIPADYEAKADAFKRKGIIPAMTTGEPALETASPVRQRESVGIGPNLLLLLLWPFQLFLILLAAIPLAIFSLFGLFDRGATKLGGERYVAGRDRALDLMLRLVGLVMIASFILIAVAYCNRTSNSDCDWDRSGETCYPG